jgi:phenylalanyl-tRNA synthetase beta subunit
VLIEDVARVIGYDAITGAPSAETPTAGATTALDARARPPAGFWPATDSSSCAAFRSNHSRAKRTFRRLKGDSITLTNPLNADLARLRRSLVPFLLKPRNAAKRRSTTSAISKSTRYFRGPPRNRKSTGRSASCLVER